MIVFDPIPALCLEFAGHREHFLPCALQIDGDVAQSRIAFLHGFRDLCVEGAYAITKFIDELSASLEAITFQ